MVLHVLSHPLDGFLERKGIRLQSKDPDQTSDLRWDLIGHYRLGKETDRPSLAMHARILWLLFKYLSFVYYPAWTLSQHY